MATLTVDTAAGTGAAADAGLNYGYRVAVDQAGGRVFDQPPTLGIAMPRRAFTRLLWRDDQGRVLVWSDV